MRKKELTYRILNKRTTLGIILLTICHFGVSKASIIIIIIALVVIGFIGDIFITKWIKI